MTLPLPANEDQLCLLQTVWDLFFAASRWPTFRQVDRRLDRTHGLDAFEVGHKMPMELLIPPMRLVPSDEQELRLSIAGLAACSGSHEDVDIFLQALRLATDVERGSGLGVDDEAPVLSAEVVSQELPWTAAGRSALLTRLGLILATENWGWRSAQPGGPDW